MDVIVLEEVLVELANLPVRERVAIDNALEKLRLHATQLGFPHSSQIKGTDFRELRPRAGRSPWRAIYKQQGQVIIVVLAISPEAMHDKRGFERAITTARKRLAAFEVNKGGKL